MKAPDKIYIAVYPNDDGLDTHLGDWYSEPEFHAEDNLEYINENALLEWIESEMVRLWELLPDADNPNPTQMELRYLGQYMQMEALEDKINSL